MDGDAEGQQDGGVGDSVERRHAPDFVEGSGDIAAPGAREKGTEEIRRDRAGEEVNGREGEGGRARGPFALCGSELPWAIRS